MKLIPMDNQSYGDNRLIYHVPSYYITYSQVLRRLMMGIHIHPFP